jgi:hypothetical protein
VASDAAWAAMVATARRHGYLGPLTPTTEAELLVLADALREATGVAPVPGTGPGAYVHRVLATLAQLEGTAPWN